MSPLIVTTHVPVPVQPPPLHPVKSEPTFADAVRVTWDPNVKGAAQLPPQFIPEGELVTFPNPFPGFAIVRVRTILVKVAVTEAAALMVTTHVPVPEHPAPVHPSKLEPDAGVAVSVTTVPTLNGSEQSAPQSMPVGKLAMVPCPVPAAAAVSINVLRVKVAVTVAAALIVITHVPVPEHPPPVQPVKFELGLADAVNVTTVPNVYVSVQSAPQLIPVGELVTDPPPLPANDTSKANVFIAKVAITVVAAVIVTMQVPVPEHPPPVQPVKFELALGVAVSVTAVP